MMSPSEQAVADLAKQALSEFCRLWVDDPDVGRLGGAALEATSVSQAGAYVRLRKAPFESSKRRILRADWTVDGRLGVVDVLLWLGNLEPPELELIKYDFEAEWPKGTLIAHNPHDG